jgi:hypothetical protein
MVGGTLMMNLDIGELESQLVQNGTAVEVHISPIRKDNGTFNFADFFAEINEDYYGALREHYTADAKAGKTGG